MTEKGEHYLEYQADTKQILYREETNNEKVQELADDVSAFNVDLSEFSANRSLILSLSFEKNGRSHSLSCNLTARNDVLIDDESVDHASIIIQSDLVLEPNEEYVLPVNINGNVSGYSCFLSQTTSLQTDATITQNGISIRIGRDEKGNNGMLYLTVSTNDCKENSSVPLSTKVVNIRIRRVTGMTASYTVKAGTQYKKNSVYQINTTLFGTYLNMQSGINTDEVQYINPYLADWDWEFDYTENGIKANIDDYFQIEEDTGSDRNYPYLLVTLKREMPEGSILRCKVKARHPLGKVENSNTNKTGKEYDDIYEIVEIEREENLFQMTDFLRGEGFNFPFELTGFKIDGKEFSNYDEMVKYIKSHFSSEENRMQFRWFYRIRPITGRDDAGNKIYGDYSMFAACQNGSNQMQMTETENMRLLPEYEYEVNYIAVMYTNEYINGNSYPVATHYWPYWDTRFYGYTDIYGNVKDYGDFDRFRMVWDYNLRKIDNEEYLKQYFFSYTVPRASIHFTKNSLYEISTGDSHCGTEETPLVVENGRIFKTGLYWYYVSPYKYEDNLRIRIEKKNGDGWDVIENGCTTYSQNGLQINMDKTYIMVNNTGAATGDYRLTFWLENARFSRLNTSYLDYRLWPSNYDYFCQDHELYYVDDDQVEHGVLYIRIP